MIALESWEATFSNNRTEACGKQEPQSVSMKAQVLCDSIRFGIRRRLQDCIAAGDDVFGTLICLYFRNDGLLISEYVYTGLPFLTNAVSACETNTRRPCTQRSQRTTRVKCVASHVRRSLAEACFLLGPLLSPGHRTHQQHGSFRPCGYFNYIF